MFGTEYYSLCSAGRMVLPIRSWTFQRSVANPRVTIIASIRAKVQRTFPIQENQPQLAQCGGGGVEDEGMGKR